MKCDLNPDLYVICVEQKSSETFIPLNGFHFDVKSYVYTIYETFVFKNKDHFVLMKQPGVYIPVNKKFEN